MRAECLLPKCFSIGFAYSPSRYFLQYRCSIVVLSPKSFLFVDGLLKARKMIRKLRMFAWLTVLFALFLWVSPANAVEYGLKIAGVSVTDKNCKDLSKIKEGIEVADGGYFKYDPDMKTLSMKGVKVPESSGIGDPIIDNENIDGLIINISGKINVELYDLVMLLKKSTIIQGDGQLDLSTYGDKVISVQSEATLTISNTDLKVEAQGKEGIMGTTNKEKLIIDNAKVWSNAIANFAKCTFNNCRIVKPEGATWDNSKHMIVDKNHQMADYVEIQPNDYLGLFIANVAVTDKNCKDLSKIGEGIKVAEGGYFKYEPTTKTLSMKGVTIDCEGIPISNRRVENLIIDVSGENKLKGSAWYAAGIYLEKSTTLQGDGKLLVESLGSQGIKLESNVTLTISNITLEVEGKPQGIKGQWGTDHETLIINNAVVSVKGAEVAIDDLAKFTLTGCDIISPAGGNFDATKHVVVDADGNKAKEVKIAPIIEYGLKIANVRVTNANFNDLSGITGVTVLEGGYFKYDPAIKTLLMKGVTIESSEIAIYNQSIEELIIKVSGENKLKMTNATGFTLAESTTIQGDGKLIIEAKSTAGCYIFKRGVSLTISEITLETSGEYGIAGVDGKHEETLIIKHAAVTAKGSKFAIGDLAKMTLSDCRIDLPKKAQLNDTQHVVLDEKGNVAKEVKILRTNVAPTPNAVEDTLLSSIIVAPNPFSSQLRINHKEVVNARYELLDTNGSILYQGALEGTETILNSENLKAGVYLLRILSGDVVKTLRVVRE